MTTGQEMKPFPIAAIMGLLLASGCANGPSHAVGLTSKQPVWSGSVAVIEAAAKGARDCGAGVKIEPEGGNRQRMTLDGASVTYSQFICLLNWTQDYQRELGSHYQRELGLHYRFE